MLTVAGHNGIHRLLDGREILFKKKNAEDLFSVFAEIMLLVFHLSSAHLKNR